LRTDSEIAVATGKGDGLATIYRLWTRSRLHSPWECNGRDSTAQRHDIRDTFAIDSWFRYRVSPLYYPLLRVLHTLPPLRFASPGPVGLDADTWSLPDIWNSLARHVGLHHPPGITSSMINLINCPHSPVKTAWLQQFRNWLPSDRRVDVRFCLHSPSIVSRDDLCVCGRPLC